MHHIGIDLGGKKSQICVRAADSSIVAEFEARTHHLAKALADFPKSRVILETCAEAFSVARLLQDEGHDVRIVPATLVRQLGVGHRGVKTDKRDAQALSQVSCRIEVASVHLPSIRSREIRAVLKLRDGLVKSRTQMVNSVRSWARERLIDLPKGTPLGFPRKIRACLEEYPDGLPGCVERQLQVIELLNAQIKEADVEIESLRQSHPVASQLSKLFGVGGIAALYFVSMLDTQERFSDVKAVYSYLGMTPREYSSADKRNKYGITKAGPADVRRTLVQSAWVIWQKRPNDPLAVWGQRIAERRGRKVAILAMARKLAGIMYAMWRDGSSYRPHLVTSLDT
ncbi:MAG: IS110 family transposase [Myxococcota bacterium]